jgi:hypothetical protein
MLSTVRECFRQSWNDFDRLGIPLYRAGMLYRWVQCFLEGWNTLLQSWNAFERVGIPLYRVEMLSRGLECFRRSGNTFVQSWNAFGRDGMLSAGLEYFQQS